MGKGRLLLLPWMEENIMIYSLVIGRFQPPHEGHFALIQKLFDEGKNVCVACRDRYHPDTDPYQFQERAHIFTEQFKEYIAAKRLKIIPIPDIEEVVYGRKVGWGIREIQLDTKTEAISATNIRKQMNEVKNDKS